MLEDAWLVAPARPHAYHRARRDKLRAIRAAIRNRLRPGVDIDAAASALLDAAIRAGHVDGDTAYICIPAGLSASGRPVPLVV